jgi:hypothetical protein
MHDKPAAGIAAWCRAELGVPTIVPAFVETARAACGGQLFHQTEHASRCSAQPIVDNTSGDLAQINFLWTVAWLGTISVHCS